MNTKAVILIILCAVLAIVTIKGLTTNGRAEDYSANSSESKSEVMIQEARQKGMPAWLLFHSTTCASCIEMEKIYLALKPEFEGKVVFVEIDVNNPVEQELCYQYELEYIPSTFFLNSKGEITFKYVGVIKEDDMRAKLKSLAEGR